jgi:hypothetical protein
MPSSLYEFVVSMFLSVNGDPVLLSINQNGFLL